MLRTLLLLGTLALPLCMRGQWDLKPSPTSASLRGIASVGEGAAWASGTGGTVLRSVDGGDHWQPCVVPPGAGKLDFRAVQAWDAQTAIVMSAGPGDLSRLYRTADGCRSWALLLSNPDPTGFWDALQFTDRDHGLLLGDPVKGHFVLLSTEDGGRTWKPEVAGTGEPVVQQSIFAASNSSLLLRSVSSRMYCTGGLAGAMIVRQAVGPYAGKTGPGEIPWVRTTSSEELGNEGKAESSGCFSLAENHDGQGTVVAVGGDYAHPAETADTAWTTAGAEDGEKKQHPLFTFSPAKTKPGGYRSAVAYDKEDRCWLAVGPTGTDISTDDGRNWLPLRPGSKDAPGADAEWNAISLPFVVGPHGRIGKLRAPLAR